MTDNDPVIIEYWRGRPVFHAFDQGFATYAVQLAGDTTARRGCSSFGLDHVDWDARLVVTS